MPSLVELLIHRGVQRRYAADALLIIEGDVGDTLYIVLEGRLRAYSSDESGRLLIYGDYGPGEYLGEMSLDGGPRSASVKALEPTICSVVNRETLRRFIGEHPDFAFELLGRVIKRARQATESARSFALLDVYSRVNRLLTQMAKSQPDGTWLIEQTLTHAEIAGHVGCTREMVSRILKDLRVGGYLDTSEAQWRLLRRLPAAW